jgi:hypothetical protein
MAMKGHGGRLWAILAFAAIGSTVLSLGRVRGLDGTPSCSDSVAGTCANGTPVCNVLTDCNDACSPNLNNTPCATANLNTCFNVTCDNGQCSNASFLDSTYSGTCTNSTTHVCNIGDCEGLCSDANVNSTCATTDFNLCYQGICELYGENNTADCVPKMVVPQECNDLVANDLCLTNASCDPTANVGRGECTSTRIQNCTDDDGDGVDSSVEDAVPSDPSSSIQPTGDGDGDGILDSLEHNVTSLPVGEPGKGYVTLISSCDQNLNVQTTTEAALGNDPTYDAPFGYVGFKTCNGGVACTGTCSSAVIKLIFHGAGDLSSAVLRKYGPTTPGNPATAKFYTFTPVTISGNMMTYTLNDGQLGDATVVDGMIVDPVAPAVTAANAVPAMTPWALAAAVLLLGSVALFALRRRQNLRPQ